MKNLRLILLAAAALAAGPSNATAQTAITLGTAATFGVLGGSTVTNTGATIVNGDFGVSPGATYTGFPPGVIVNGAIYTFIDATAISAHSDAVAAYNTLAGEAFTSVRTGQDLGGLTLTTGVYFYSAAAQLTGTLTLDGGGDANARFDFQIGSTLTTAAGSDIQFINGAQSANLYWQVGSSATFLTSSGMAGTVLAAVSITAVTGTTVDGRLIALGGAVTLDTNTISVPTAIPEPATTTALVAGLIGLVLMVRRIRRPA